jgi:hypothetical protein
MASLSFLQARARLACAGQIVRPNRNATTCRSATRRPKIGKRASGSDGGPSRAVISENWTMDKTWLVVMSLFAGVVLIAAAAWRPLARRMRKRRVAEALRLFRLQREMLEAQFFHQASSLGKPRGLRWVECDWQDAVTFGRDVKNGMITAFVGVNIRFEAIEGGDMEGVEAVSAIREAAAMFHYQRDRWGTGGRALFNLNPADALAHYQGQIEPIQRETGGAPQSAAH